MTLYNATLVFLDSKSRETTRSYVIDEIDETSMEIVLGLLVTAFEAISEGTVLRAIVTRDFFYSNSADAGSNRDENMSVLVRKGNDHRADFNIPMPIAGIILGDGAMDLTATQVTTLFGLFTTDEHCRVNHQNPDFIKAVLSGYLDE